MDTSCDAGIAQVVERRPEKPRVPSASLGPGAISLTERSWLKH